MKEPRTLYWAIRATNGQEIRGQSPNLICSCERYVSILRRKYEAIDIQAISVGIEPSAQII